MLKKQAAKEFLMSFLYYKANISATMKKFRYCGHCGNNTFYALISGESGCSTHMCGYCHRVLKLKQGETISSCQYVDVPIFWTNESFDY